jgi:hypothetical protein
VLNSKWLDIAIGVVFVWFLLSILVSVINEGINRAFSVRSKQLWMALAQIMDGEDQLKPVWRQWFAIPFFQGRPSDPSDHQNDMTNLRDAEAAAITAAPQTQQDALAAAETAVAAAQTRLAAAQALDPAVPQQTEAAEAALAIANQQRDAARQAAFDAAPADTRLVLDNARKAMKVSKALYGTQTIQAMENHKSPDRKTKIHNVPNTVFTQALIELGVKDAADSQRSVESYLKDLPDPIGSQLRTIWATSRRDILEFRRQAEQWFDGQMARLSSLYRSQTRIVMVLLGAVVAVVGFGVGLRTDTLGLVSDLQRDANLRSAFADLGTQVSKADLQDLAEAGCPTTTTVEGDSPSFQCVARGLEAYENVDLIFDDRGAGTPSDDSTFGTWWSSFWGQLGDLWTWRRLAGVVLTAVALSFGASFWYNVLRRLVGLRQGGKSAASA